MARVGLLSIAIAVAACSADHKRKPLEEVPLDYGTHASADVPSASTSASATQTAPPPSKSVAAEAKALMNRGNNKGARALLEPRVDDGSATTEEKTLLRGICKAMRDTRCVAKTK